MKDADFSLRETEAVDFKALSEYGLPIIVDYGADTCIPCKEMAPILEKANKEFQGKAFIKFVNVWDYPDAANNVPVQVIPHRYCLTQTGHRLYRVMNYQRKFNLICTLTKILENISSPYIKVA